MAEWLYDKNGSPTLILDGERLRNSHGEVVGWIRGTSVFSTNGTHVGWCDGGVIYDEDNCALAFSRNLTATLPSTPGLGGSPGMPGFAGVPSRPGFSGTPGKRGRGGWSLRDAGRYFSG